MAKKNNPITTALFMVCIILAASLIIVVANYRGQSNTSQVTSLQAEVDSLTSTVSEYEKQVSDLTKTNKEYASIIGLELSTNVIDSGLTHTQAAGATTVIYNDKFFYAGYLEIQVESTSATAYVQVSYTYNGLKFDQTITVGHKGTAYFPVLPTTITITIGNTDTDSTKTIDTTALANLIY